MVQWLPIFGLILLGKTTQGSREGGTSILKDLMEDPKFQLEFTDNFIPESSLDLLLNPERGLPDLDENGENNNQTRSSRRVVVMSDSGERYLCDIATPEEEFEIDEKPGLAPEDIEQVHQEGIGRGVSVLDSMDGECLFMRSGWWSYKFCFNRDVSQFHIPTAEEGIPEDTPITTYVLGRFTQPMPLTSVLTQELDGEEEEESTSVATYSGATAAVRATATKNILVQRWGGGTPCDLNRQQRSVEVHYECHPGQPSQILSVKEPKSCHYRVEISTPKLCAHSFYAEKNRAPILPIKCSEVVVDEQMESRRQEAAAARRRAEANAAAELEADKAAKENIQKLGVVSKVIPLSSLFNSLQPGTGGLKSVLQGMANQKQPPAQKDEAKPQENKDTAATNTDPADKTSEVVEALTRLFGFDVLTGEPVDPPAKKKPEQNENSDDQAEYDEL